jgi:hypothetical protein
MGGTVGGADIPTFKVGRNIRILAYLWLAVGLELGDRILCIKANVASSIVITVVVFLPGDLCVCTIS